MNKSSHSNIYKKDDPKKDWPLRVAAGINVFPINALESTLRNVCMDL